MLASIGLVAQHYWKLPGFENLPSGFSILGKEEGVIGLFALFLVSGCLENVWREDPSGTKEPGNFGDPFGLQMYNEEMRTKELNNGRMAMISVLGIFAAEMASGQDAIQQFGLQALGSRQVALSRRSFTGKTSSLRQVSVTRRAFQPSQQIGASEPLGFFDPLGFSTPRRAVDGPVSNLQFLADNTVLGRTIYGLFSGRRIDEGKFLHDLRDQWRGFLWRTVAVNRPQHYGGAESIDRPRTLRLYETLRSVADTEDLDECLGDDKSVQRRQLGVLRRIFAGGLMTPERSARHKRLSNDRLCACGGDKETIFHISWYCSQYSHIRMEVLDSFSNLGISLESLPVCFTYAGIVPTDFFLSDELIERVHRMLISIWQEHIKNWHAGKDLGEVVSKARSERTMVGGLISENGHLLAPRDTGSGLWCRRCGKYVQRLEHVRLKITGQPCDHPNGPLLHSEGYSRSSARLDALERELNLKYNRGRHMLLWNRKVGKVIGSSDEGFIRCLKCKRQWRWKDRVNNLLRTTCIVSQSVHFTKRIRNKSSLSHVQDNLTVSPLWRNEAQIDVLPPDRVGVG